MHAAMEGAVPYIALENTEVLSEIGGYLGVFRERVFVAEFNVDPIDGPSHSG